MTILASEYTDLVTSEYSAQPNFIAMLQLFADWSAARQNLVATFPGLYDLDTAVGTQLDAVGQWVGITRYLPTPLVGVYFSFDIAGLGFDQGVWLGPFDPVTGLVALPDDQYRIVLRAKIAANQWDGSTTEIYAILQEIYGNVVSVQDGQDMTMTVGLTTLPTVAVLAQLLFGGYIAIKPSGVRINYVTSSVNGAPIFGFDVTNSLIAGFDVGAWATPQGSA